MIYHHRPRSPLEDEIDEAIARIYKKYGTDLQAFFRDVQQDVKRQRKQLEYAQRTARGDRPINRPLQTTGVVANQSEKARSNPNAE